MNTIFLILFKNINKFDNKNFIYQTINIYIAINIYLNYYFLINYLN
jgi:hypothetical protein